MTEGNPLRRARDYALELVDLMSADRPSVHAGGPFEESCSSTHWLGRGALSNLRGIRTPRHEFADVFAPHQSLLRDDLGDEVAPDDVQQRLWGVFTVHYPHADAAAARSVSAGISSGVRVPDAARARTRRA